MKIIQACALAASAAGIFASAPAAAQLAAASTPAATTQKATDKSSEVVCEKQTITGSRLGSRRVCMTRAKWAELRLQDRQDTERVQTNRGMKGE